MELNAGDAEPNALLFVFPKETADPKPDIFVFAAAPKLPNDGRAEFVWVCDCSPNVGATTDGCPNVDKLLAVLFNDGDERNINEVDVCADGWALLFDTVTFGDENIDVVMGAVMPNEELAGAKDVDDAPNREFVVVGNVVPAADEPNTNAEDFVAAVFVVSTLLKDNVGWLIWALFTEWLDGVETEPKIGCILAAGFNSSVDFEENENPPFLSSGFEPNTNVAACFVFDILSNSGVLFSSDVDNIVVIALLLSGCTVEGTRGTVLAVAGLPKLNNGLSAVAATSTGCFFSVIGCEDPKLNLGLALIEEKLVAGALTIDFVTFKVEVVDDVFNVSNGLLVEPKTILLIVFGTSFESSDFFKAPKEIGLFVVIRDFASIICLVGVVPNLIPANGESVVSFLTVDASDFFGNPNENVGAKIKNKNKTIFKISMASLNSMILKY